MNRIDFESRQPLQSQLRILFWVNFAFCVWCTLPSIASASDEMPSSQLPIPQVRTAELPANSVKPGPDRIMAMKVEITSHGYPVMIVTNLAGVRLDPGARQLEQVHLFLQARNRTSGEVQELAQIRCNHGKTPQLTHAWMVALDPGEYSIELEWAVRPWGIVVVGEEGLGPVKLFAYELAGADALLTLEREVRGEVASLAVAMDRQKPSGPLSDDDKKELLNDREFLKTLAKEVKRLELDHEPSANPAEEDQK